MIVVGTPDQVRPEGTGQQLVPAGIQYHFLCHRLAAGIMTQPAARVGNRFIDPLLAAAVKSHAGATGEDKLPHAVGPALPQATAAADLGDGAGRADGGVGGARRAAHGRIPAHLQFWIKT